VGLEDLVGQEEMGDPVGLVDLVGSLELDEALRRPCALTDFRTEHLLQCVAPILCTCDEVSEQLTVLSSNVLQKETFGCPSACTACSGREASLQGHRRPRVRFAAVWT
jgi:hypothetical protein